jgi:hypothetical protein
MLLLIISFVEYQVSSLPSRGAAMHGTSMPKNGSCQPNAYLRRDPIIFIVALNGYLLELNMSPSCLSFGYALSGYCAKR